MKLHHRKKFSVRIFTAILLVSILAATILTGFAYFRERNMTLQHVGQSMTRNLTWASTTINQTLNQAENLFYRLQADSRLFSLLNNYDATETSPASANRTFQTVVNSYLSGDSAICDVQLFRSDLALSLNNVSSSTAANFQNTGFAQKAETAGTYYWEPTYDYVQTYGHTQLKDVNVENRYLVSLIGRLNLYSLENSRLEYLNADSQKPVLLISISENYFASALPESDYENTLTVLLDENGCLISSNRGNEVSPVVFEAVLTAANDRQMIQNVQGEKKLVFSEQLSNGWYLASLVSYKSVWKSIAIGLTAPLLLVFTGLIVLCAVVSRSISRALSRPISELLQGIAQTEQGHFDTHLLETDDEFGTVMASYNRMSRRITEMMEENYQVRSREREAEMAALRYQTNPHFLYNALNILYIRALSENAPDTANLIQLLARVMRYVIRDHRDIVCVSDEIQNARAYFELMNAGYENALRLEIDVDDELMDARLPKLCLQPLLENAILHGISGYTQNGLIRICAHFENEWLILSVDDNGAGLTEQTDSGIGGGKKTIGVANVRKRLQYLFGKESSLELVPSDLGGVSARLKLPRQYEKDTTNQK